MTPDRRGTAAAVNIDSTLAASRTLAIDRAIAANVIHAVQKAINEPVVHVVDKAGNSPATSAIAASPKLFRRMNITIETARTTTTVPAVRHSVLLLMTRTATSNTADPTNTTPGTSLLADLRTAQNARKVSSDGYRLSGSPSA
jgi:hypothetical protein